MLFFSRKSLLTAVLAIFGTGLMLTDARAASVITVDLDANGNGRFYDYFSNAYAQIDLDPDGMYDINANTLYSAVDGFPSEGNWAAVGTLTLDSTATGSGVETLNIASATFDFNQYVDGSALSIAGFPYTTDVTVTSGSVELTNGVITDITLDSDIAFTFGSFPSNPFNGDFDISAGTFSLLVDDTEDPGFGAVRQAWDFDGTASSPTVIPEPASLMLLAAGGLMIATRRRRG